MNRKLLGLFVAAIVTLGMTASLAVAGSPYTVSVSGPDSVIEGNGFTATVTIDNEGDDMSGWSYGVCTDAAQMSCDEFGASDTDTVNGGGAAGFLTNTLYSDGFTQGVVIDLFGAQVLPAGATGFQAANVACTAVGAPDTDACMAICSTLGSPPVATVVVVNGASLSPETVDDCVAITAPPPALDYRRGDSNDDGQVNIADIIWLLSELFLSGATNDCVGADDSNGDGAIDAADAVYTANMLFLAGPDPAAPYPDCGVDGDPDPSDCAEYNSCDQGGAVTFQNTIQPILASACAPCHTPEGGQHGPSAGLILTENAYGNLVNVPSGQCDQTNLITPGDAYGSWLYRKIEGTHLDKDILDLGCCPDTDNDGDPDGCGGQMPKGCGSFGGPCLDAATLSLFETWISNGAPEAP